MHALFGEGDVSLCGFGRGFGALGAVAGDVEFEDRGVVYDAVDGGGGGHGVAKDAVPLAEHEVAGDDQRAPLVSLSSRKERLFRS